MLYDDAASAAQEAAEDMGSDPALGDAIRSGDEAAVQQAASDLAEENDVKTLVLRDAEGEELASVGEGAPFAPTLLDLTGDDGSTAAQLSVSVTDEKSYLAEVERLTGRPAALYVVGQPSVTVSGDSVDVPQEEAADVTVNGEEQRVLTGDLSDDEGQRIALFGPIEESDVLASSPAIAAILVGAVPDRARVRAQHQAPALGSGQGDVRGGEADRRR